MCYLIVFFVVVVIMMVVGFDVFVWLYMVVEGVIVVVIGGIFVSLVAYVVLCFYRIA